MNIFVTQDEFLYKVLKPAEDTGRVEYKYLIAVTIEYIRCLEFEVVRVQPFIYEFLIELFVRNKIIYQLHQFFQYHVISDSLPVACQLLSLSNTYPPAYQLALDMLKRLDEKGHILEVLLSQGQILKAVKFVKKYNLFKNVRANIFLEKALETKNNMTFYTVFSFLEERKLLDNSCQPYVKKYNELFSQNK